MTSIHNLLICSTKVILKLQNCLSSFLCIAPLGQGAAVVFRTLEQLPCHDLWWLRNRATSLQTTLATVSLNIPLHATSSHAELLQNCNVEITAIKIIVWIHHTCSSAQARLALYWTFQGLALRLIPRVLVLPVVSSTLILCVSLLPRKIYSLWYFWKN